jgi:hypothetical protein
LAAHAGERHGVGQSAKLVADHASAIVKLELELAAAELKRKVVALGIGIGMALVAAILLFFAVGFGLAAGAAALATAVSTWLALLIVTGGLLALAALLGLVGVGAIKRGTPPVPEQAIEEAKLTAEALRSNGRH